MRIIFSKSDGTIRGGKIMILEWYCEGLVISGNTIDVWYGIGENGQKIFVPVQGISKEINKDMGKIKGKLFHKNEFKYSPGRPQFVSEVYNRYTLLVNDMIAARGILEGVCNAEDA